MGSFLLDKRENRSRAVRQRVILSRRSSFIIMITLIWVFLVTFLHTVSSYNYCSVTPNHTLCGYTGVPRDKCLNTKVYTRGLSERDKKTDTGLPQQAEVCPGPGAHQTARGL